ncbi:MAG: flagellar biosynthesis protein FlgA, partial [Negativicutes bacterium]|nr:flagellar biosynthesis protein FlgA [Negativicutes bacterium]
MIYQHLYSQFQKKEHITAGIIGTGHFGTAVITQSMFSNHLSIPIVADQNIDNAKKAYNQAGVTGDKLVVCDSAAAAKRAMEQGKFVIVQDPMILMELPLDVIGESTGIPEAGARHALAAIKHGKHVAMINKETDSAVGPILQHLASQAGLVYTPVDGDQHGLLIGLFYWAKTLGLDVISAGKARDAEFILDRKKKTVTC